MNYRALSNGELKPLDDLINALGFQHFFTGEFTLEGNDPILRSPHRLGCLLITSEQQNSLQGDLVI